MGVIMFVIGGEREFFFFIFFVIDCVVVKFNGKVNENVF